MLAPEHIQTERLILRLPGLSDAEAIFEGYGGDPEVTRYLIWRPHETVEMTTRFVERCIACWREGTAFPWAIIHKADRRLIGMIEMLFPMFGHLIGSDFLGPHFKFTVVYFAYFVIVVLRPQGLFGWKR